MPTTYRATLTEVGAALVADAIASGTTLTWAKMALGDGNGSAVTVDPSRTSLVNEQYRAPLNDLGRDSANPNTIVGTLVVPPETGGWTIREFGIYDNAATPRLVAYGETPEIEKPASSAGTGINLRLRFKLVVSAEANITLAPDSNEAYATIEYVKDNAVKSLSVSGRTITYTMGDGDTHTITTQDTTYDDATQSAHGLMSAEDKTTLDNVPTTYVKKAGDTVTGEIASSYGAANTTGAVNHFSGTMAVNDGWAIRAGANASNDGYLEIATRDDGTEPIYVRQYTGAFATLKRSATLLDGSGNTVFPGSVTANGGFVGALTGNASSATQFSANKSVELTGDVTGKASSKAGWTVTTTLTNSGVTAGSYGPSANATPNYGATFNVPYVTVDAKGRVTAASTKTVKIPNSINSINGILNVSKGGTGESTLYNAFKALVHSTKNYTLTDTTLNTNICTSGKVQYVVAGNIIFVYFTDVKLKAATPTFTSVKIASNLPKYNYLVPSFVQVYTFWADQANQGKTGFYVSSTGEAYLFTREFVVGSNLSIYGVCATPFAL